MCVYLLIILTLLANRGHFAGSHTFKRSVWQFRHVFKVDIWNQVRVVVLCVSYPKHAEVNRWPMR